VPGLLQAGGQAAAQDGFVDVGGVAADVGQHAGNGGAAQLRGGDGANCPWKAPMGCGARPR
jgi:hypothetical protein